MKRIVVLVGPPGVGKSTIVSLAKKKGIYAVDIEEVHNETKKQFNHLSGDEYKKALSEEMEEKIMTLLTDAPDGISIFGAGGYGGSFPQEMVERVLLLPERRVAEKRFIARDEDNPEKKQQNQKFGLIYDMFIDRLRNNPELYHRVLARSTTAEEILEEILNGR